MTTNFGASNQPSNELIDIGNPSSQNPCLPFWDGKRIEDIGAHARNINDWRNNTSKKQCGSVSLMEHVLEACDLDTYAYTHGQIEWENGIVAY